MIDELIKTKAALDALGVPRRLITLEGKPYATGTVKSVNGTLPDGRGDVTITTSGGSGTPGGANTQIQYNNNGSFAGSSALITSATYPVQATQSNTTGTTNVLRAVFGTNEALLLRQNSAPAGFTDLRIEGITNAPPILTLQAPNGTDYADFTFDGANCELEVQNGDLNLRPLTSGKNVNVWSPAANAKFRVGNQNFTQSVDTTHDGTNGHISTTTGDVELNPATNVKIYQASGTAQLRIGSSGFVRSLDMQHDGTNATVSTTIGDLILSPNSNKVRTASGTHDLSGLTATRTYTWPDKSGTVAMTSDISGSSGITRSINVITTNTTGAAAASTDYVYFASGAITLTLPTAVGNTNQYTIKKTDGPGTNVTVATTSAQTIDGATTQIIATQYTTLTAISDGANWNIV